MSLWDRLLRRGRRTGDGDDDDETPPEWASLVARARSLPGEARPGRDLWSGIENRIAGRTAQPERGGGWITSFFPRPLAAAAVAVALVATTALGVSLYWSRVQAGATAEAPILASRSEDPSAIAARLRERDGVADVHRNIHALLEAHRATLPPETVAVLEENLLRIDRAIAEIHFALESNPDHHGLAFMLAEAYRSEAELLERLEWWLQESPETTS